jgi:hypothetical protein
MIKLISINKGKIAFQVLLIVLFQWTTIAYQFNLYNTDQRFTRHPFQFDCLNYHIRREKLAYQDIPDVADDIIPYCFRPVTDFHESVEGFVDPLSQKLSHPTCPSTKICLCPSCFFGNQCQLYAKGLGSTLDEILGYEFKRNTVLYKQPLRVQVAATITMILFLIGLINSILSIITFSRPKSHEVGCGIYLLASSITSLLTTIALVLKFWFLFHSYQDSTGLRNVLKGNCFGIEPLLKLFLYIDTWLNACVAIERTVTAIRGGGFNKQLSRKIAVWIIAILALTIIGLFIPQAIYLYIFDDEMEERSWCVVTYVKWLATYSSTLIFVHYFAPLAINIFSIICIMIITALRRGKSQRNHSFCVHLRSRLIKNKHILISSAIIICLTLPHLIISIILDCQKSSHLFWFYLIGYYLSFCICVNVGRHSDRNHRDFNLSAYESH